jgi:biopolymer transport protein ExbD
MKLNVESMDEPGINIASLIDLVFLLLVYFMVAASLQKSEADLSIRLPGMVAQKQSVEMPDEQLIEVRDSGHVILNEQQYDSPDSMELPNLVAMLTRYRMSCEAANIPAMITIMADDGTRHQRVIDVMNACAKAQIRNVTFNTSGE